MVEKTDVYPVDKDVPIPEPRPSGVPISTLEVGESILFPREERAAVSSNAAKLKKRKGMEFTVRLEDEHSCRVWRIA